MLRAHPQTNEARSTVFSRNLEWSRLLLGAEVDPARWYDLLGARVLGSDSEHPQANMGFWAERNGARPSTLAEAADAMFHLVASGARLSAEVEHVVDVGCGFGVNTSWCVQRRGVRRATGVNISTSQVAWARDRVERQGLAARVDFVEASATSMPFDKASVDAVVSIEAAFHFDSREAFFREAARVLKPGGVLSMVDLLAEPPRDWLSSLMLGHVRRGVQLPLCNVVTTGQYRASLEDAGFELEQLQFIEADVVPFFRRWFFSQPLRALAAYDFAMMVGNASYFFWPWRYPRIVARRRGGQ